MELTIDGIAVTVAGIETEELQAIHARLQQLLEEPPSRIKNRDAIASAFAYGVELCPEINASDLWHHVIYREYLRTIKAARRVNDPGQSWKRSSGEAFEVFLQDYYTRRLSQHGIWMKALFADDRNQTIVEMGIANEVGSAKLDLSIRGPTRLFGGVHAKVSLAERVTDDVPASLLMMREGYLSALVTLDVKSFPPSINIPDRRAYQNRGELGSPSAPTDKRQYIELHGDFDLCVSYNSRTVPSGNNTPSGKRIYIAKFGQDMPDPLEQMILSRR